jgi:hypothetical protein
MLTQILAHTPAWVWGLLAALIALGLVQTRTRRVARAQLLALPLAMLGLGLWSLAPVFAVLPLAGLVWLAALFVGGWLGRRLLLPARARWQAELRRMELPGSWLPMTLILAIFALRYVAGASQAMHPEWRTAAAVQLPLAGLFGALSGMFVGRALGLLQLAREPAHRAATITRDGSFDPV